MMDPADRKDGILRHLEASSIEVQRYFWTLDASARHRAIYADPEGWTVKQVLAHLVGIERSMHWLFRNILEGGDGSPADFDIDRFNAEQPRKLDALGLEALIARYRAVRAETLAIVEGMREEDLDLEGRHAFWGRGRLEEFVRWAYLHEQQHLTEVRAAVAGRRAALRSMLEAHQASDAEEEGHRRAMLALVEAEGDPFRRDHFVPGHFTASAFVLSPEKDALLLIYHGKLKRWLQPGGHVDAADRDIVAAARREVAEETGLVDLKWMGAGPLDVDVHAIPARGPEPDHLHFDVRFAFRAVSRAGAAASDAVAMRWVPLEEVKLEETDASVMRAVNGLRSGS